MSVALGVVILPETRWRDAAAQWRRAEELGFTHAWTYDHLAWRTLRDDPWFGAMPTLTAAATVTERIVLGPLVASPNFRHPVPFAKELMTLDDISQGRVIAGIGAGGPGWDATMLGGEPLPTPARADRFREFVEALDVVLDNERASYDGRYYTAVEARSLPGCVQQPRVPFAIAATGPRGMRLAAKYGAYWVTPGPDVAAQVVQLEDACAAVNRDPASIRRMLLTGFQCSPGLSSPSEFADAIAEYEAMGMTDVVVHWPRSSDPFAGDLETFEACITSFVT